MSALRVRVAPRRSRGGPSGVAAARRHRLGGRMGYEIDLVHLAAQPAAVVRAHVGHDAIGDFLGQAFGEVMSSVGEQGLRPAGPPFGRYRPAEDGGWDVEAVFLDAAAPTETGRVQPATLPAGSAAHTTHVGDYGSLG